MRFSTTLGLLLLLAGAVVAVTVWWDRSVEPGEEQPVMWRIDTAEVHTFELRHNSGIARRFERQETGWNHGDRARIDAALLLLSAPEAARRLTMDGNDAGSYGLDAPVLEITLGGPDTDTRTIEVGDTTPDGSRRYVRRAGDDVVFLVARSWFDALMLLLPDAKAAE